ncbi:MAG: phage tail sheath subtilisin-like domain-containing protein, partial [Thermodesulfovibrio sp.]|nr:phage tail sheath subtilisin-like domain-containing protein [Thermodesulfovibrio sp.]
LYGGGHLVAYSFAQVSPKMYAMRVLPEDAQTSNKMFFLILEKPATITADNFEVQIQHNSSGVLTNAIFVNPYGANLPTNLLGDFFWYAHINTNDPNVQLIFNRMRLMNYRLLGSRSFPNAFANLFNANNQPTGSYVLNEDYEIGIVGTGNLNVSQLNGNGRVFVHVDQPEVIVLDISVDVRYPQNVDINNIIDNIKNTWRPKYIINNWVVGVGNPISSNTYSVSVRARLPRERGVEKNAIIVTNTAGNNYYIVKIVPTTQGGHDIRIVPLPAGVSVYGTLKNYSTVIGNNIYNLRVDDSDPVKPVLIWEKDNASAEDNWNASFDTIIPLFGVFGKYRGKYYDNYRIQLLQIENENDRFLFNVYEKKKGDEILNSEFYASFEEEARDKSGENIYIKNLVERFSEDIIVEDYRERRVDLIDKFYDKLVQYGMIPQVTIVEDTKNIEKSGWYYIDQKATLSDSPLGIAASDFENYIGSLVFVRTDGTTLGSNINLVYGIGKEYKPLLFYLNGVFIMQTHPVSKKFAITNEVGPLYKGEEPDIYPVLMDGINEYDKDSGVFLARGSDGSLFNSSNQINDTIARQLLTRAYLGLIDPMVRNTEFVWIDLVLDGGYPSDVKSAIVQLVSEIRRDCVALLDNGDNRSVQESLQKRSTVHSWNSYFVAVYEPYIQIYDPFSGRDIWITPIYAVARLVALNDRVNEVWYAVAGYNRGMSNVIKALRFTPSEIGERDDLYLAQINPFVTFRDGNVLWGQLTTYKKPSNYQDLNIVRLLLYVKRALEQYCRYFIFDFIDEITMTNMEVGIRGFLEDIRRRRGLYAFNVNIHSDEYARMRKTMYVELELKPTKVLEKVKLNFYI